MVRRSVDRGETVEARAETTSNIDGDDTVSSRGVDTLEERELDVVQGGGLVECLELLNDEMRVADDVTSAVDSLGRSEVVGLSVDEVTSLEMVESHRDGKRLVRSDGLSVRREGELRGGHVRLCGDDTHRRRVARAGGDLLTVGDGEVGNGQAEVDEVVVRGRRGNLAGGRSLLAILLETSRNNIRVKS